MRVLGELRESTRFKRYGNGSGTTEDVEEGEGGMEGVDGGETHACARALVDGGDGGGDVEVAESGVADSVEHFGEEVPGRG